MHELSVCQSLLAEVERVARANHAERVTTVSIRVGPLSGVDAGLLAQAFTIARGGGVAERAELVVEPSAIRIRCRECAVESDATMSRFVCGACGGWRTDLVSGDELTLMRVELFSAD
jgi:hydrogenase nickel incorporation protein HypA/HybF